MPAARPPCRPLQALLGFGEVLPHRQRWSGPTTAPWSTRPCGASFQTPNQRFRTTYAAWLRKRARSAAYEVPRKITISDPVPSFKRASRRSEDGSTTSTPLPRNDETTEILERELMWVAYRAPSLSTIREILSILIGKRELQPTPLHYEALILGNCDPDHGSVENIPEILREMEEENVTMGAPVYNAVLKALTIHPNRELRDYILQKMSQRWIAVSVEAHHDVAAGMIREHELERAQEELSTIQEQHGSVQPWLNVMLVHALCEQRDFEAILRLAYRLHDVKGDLPRPTWLHLLKQASEHQHYYLTEWIWRRHVEPRYITPDAQICITVLKLAAQEGKPKLAESVHGILEVLTPEMAKSNNGTLEEAYERLGSYHERSSAKRLNMFSVFGDEHQNAFFDPKLALAKRSTISLRGSRRMERARSHKERLKYRSKIKRRRPVRREVVWSSVQRRRAHLQ